MAQSISPRHGLWAIFVALALASGCTPSAAPPPPRVPSVTVARPVQREVIEWDEYTGRLAPTDLVEVRARVSGLVVAAPFEAGSIVKQGDTVVQIDARPFQAELDARIGAESQAKAEVELAQIALRHLEDVPEESRSAIEHETLIAQLERARASLAQASATVESARLNVEWCRVTAPISGRISNRWIDPGNFITGGSGSGTLLTTITSIDPIYCYVDVDERSVLKYAELAREGKRTSARQARIPAFLQLADEKNYPHEGEIDFVDNRIDAATGTIRARGVFKNENGWMVPGLFGRVRVPGSGRYLAMLVPDAAVTADQDQKVLMVVDAGNIVRARPVKLGALFGEFRAVTSGITLDDRVVINGLMSAPPGAKVNPTEAQFSTESYAPTAPGSPTTQALPLVENSTGATSRPASAPAQNPSVP